jgi:hypothetical protein
MFIVVLVLITHPSVPVAANGGVEVGGNSWGQQGFFSVNRDVGYWLRFRNGVGMTHDAGDTFSL